MKPNVKKAINKYLVKTQRRCEFAQYGTYLLINGEWVRFYMVFKDGIIILREINQVEYPEFIEYNKLDDTIAYLLEHYYIRRILKERFLMQ